MPNSDLKPSKTANIAHTHNERLILGNEQNHGLSYTHELKRITSCVYVLTGTPKARASPKSASLTTPCAFTKRFCGLRSL